MLGRPGTRAPFVRKHRAAHRAWVAGIALVALVPVSARQPQSPALTDILNRTGAYLQGFVANLSNVVCEEAYVQERKAKPALKKQLTSALMLVSHPAETNNWMVFRDTTVVDGVPLPDHGDRLLELFAHPTANSWERALEISADSQRHHLLAGTIPIANPLLGAAVYQARYQRQLRFKLEGTDAAVGLSATIVSFDDPEGRIPRKPGDRVPLISPRGARGRAWIQSGTGRMLKTEVRLGYDQGSSTVTFVRDERLGIDRPGEMRTSWQDGGMARNVVTGVATYGQCRRFEVQTTETLELPKP